MMRLGTELQSTKADNDKRGAFTSFTSTRGLVSSDLEDYKGGQDTLLPKKAVLQ